MITRRYRALQVSTIVMRGLVVDTGSSDVDLDIDRLVDWQRGWGGYNR